MTIHHDTEHADRERARCRAIAENPRTPHIEAVAHFLIGHVRIDAAGGCSCGVRGELGAMYELHQAEALLALLQRRRWQP